MDISPELADKRKLFINNTPWSFWRLLDERISTEDWLGASSQALKHLSSLPVTIGTAHPVEAIADVLGEGQFGPDHWRLSRSRQVYYHLRPFLPRQLRPVLRRLFLVRQRNGFPLGWPIEDRYVRFQFESIRLLMDSKGLNSIPFIHFWPRGNRFAFVLTHDVESAQGQQFVREVASLEIHYGFRSSFNFVPEDYRVKHDLLAELQERGFEVGVHGLKHDGKLFSSRTTFLHQAQRINQYLNSWGARGFRSPLTHRHPVWMQALDVEYDSSFFDTDPYETMPGGTLSIWPFLMGQFVELPYTLPQDHTLTSTLGETTPRLWLKKVDFIERYRGMALLNTHPDYLRATENFGVYEEFLRQMRERTSYWHALPREVARWWRKRAEATAGSDKGQRFAISAPEATVGEVWLADDAVHLIANIGE